MLFIGSFSLEAAKNESIFGADRRTEPKVFVNNRVLAKINGKPITTYDLMKKMDLSFYRQYPQYANSVVARSQYYDMSWKYALEELIDKELILADAQESKVEVTQGDVRQEMETTFGPNTIANLDKVGLTFDEAAKIVQEEMIMKRMVSGRVYAKALRQVTPAKVRQAYDAYIQDPANARLAQWVYRVVTVKDRTLPKSEETAQAAYKLLGEGVPLNQLVAKMKEQKLIGRRGKVTISNDIKNNEQELSNVYKQALDPLETGMYSKPFAHKSRSDNGTVYRILYVQEKIPGSLPTYKELEMTLKNQLLDQVVDQETESYLSKLREHYHVRPEDLNAVVPEDYRPFILK